MLERILSLLDKIYRLLLFVYPAGYRRGHGLLMAQLFRDLCRDFYRQSGSWGLVKLGLLTLIDMVLTATLEHREVLMKRLAKSAQLPEGITWSRVGLTLLLGLYAVGLSLFGPYTRSSWPTFIGRALSGGLALTGLLHRTPLWSLPALGLLLGLLALPLVWLGSWLWTLILGAILVLQKRGMRLSPGAWLLLGLMFLAGLLEVATCRESGSSLSQAYCWHRTPNLAAIALIPVLIGLLPAQRFGLYTGLAVIGAETVLYAFLADPTYAMILFPTGRLVSVALNLPLLICPAWVLLARSRPGQWWGLLLPWSAILATTVIVPGLLHEYSAQLWFRHTLWAVEFFSAILLAVVVYNRFGDRSHTSIHATGSKHCGRDGLLCAD